MTHVIVDSCVRDETCVDACPVDCIHPRRGAPDFETAEQLYIDAAGCIDCGSCVDACPIGAAIADFDLPSHREHSLGWSTDFFATRRGPE